MIGVLLKPLLSPLAQGGFRMNTFSESGGVPPLTPAIRAVLVSSTPYPGLCGTGDESTDDVRVQLDIVDRAYDGMQACRAAVIAALSADVRVWIRGAITETYDVETKMHRCYFDVTLPLSSGQQNPDAPSDPEDEG